MYESDIELTWLYMEENVPDLGCSLTLHAGIWSFFFFQSILFKKNPQIPSEGQMVWIQIRLYILSCLICVQAICKGYQ